MEEEYWGDCVEPSEADLIIKEAKEKLYGILTDETKKVIEEAREAQKKVDDLDMEIRRMLAHLDWIKMEEAKEKKKWEEMKNTWIPRQYIEKMVKAVGGDWAPGDEAYTVKCTYDKCECPVCRGERKLKSVINGKEVEFRCPECDGSGEKRTPRFYVKKTTIGDVRIKLCFDSDSVRYWNTENVFLCGEDYNTDLKMLFRTEEEAQEMADKKNREMGGE